MEPHPRRLRPSTNGKWFGRRVQDSPAHRLTRSRQGKLQLTAPATGERSTKPRSTSERNWPCRWLASPATSLMRPTPCARRGRPIAATACLGEAVNSRRRRRHAQEQAWIATTTRWKPALVPVGAGAPLVGVSVGSGAPWLGEARFPAAATATRFASPCLLPSLTLQLGCPSRPRRNKQRNNGTAHDGSSAVLPETARSTDAFNHEQRRFDS